MLHLVPFDPPPKDTLKLGRCGGITAVFSVSILLKGTSKPKKIQENPPLTLERELRYEAARQFRKQKLIPKMIDRIKDLLYVHDNGSDS